MKKVNPMSYDFTNQVGERRTLKPNDKGYLLTVPDQSISISQLFERFRKTGQVPVVSTREGLDQDIGEDDDPDLHPDFEDISRLDKMEQIDLARDHAKEVERKKSIHYDALKKAGEAARVKRQAELDESVTKSLEAKAEAERKAKAKGDAKE